MPGHLLDLFSLVKLINYLNNLPEETMDLLLFEVFKNRVDLWETYFNQVSGKKSAACTNRAEGQMVPSKGSAGPFCAECPWARKMNLLLPSFSEQHSESAFLGLVSWSTLPRQSCVSSLMQCVNSRQYSCLVAPRRPCFACRTYILGDDKKK